jgi:hypothetical protein
MLKKSIKPHVGRFSSGMSGDDEEEVALTRTSQTDKGRR